MHLPLQVHVGYRILAGSDGLVHLQPLALQAYRKAQAQARDIGIDHQVGIELLVAHVPVVFVKPDVGQGFVVHNLVRGGIYRVVVAVSVPEPCSGEGEAGADGFDALRAELELHALLVDAAVVGIGAISAYDGIGIVRELLRGGFPFKARLDGGEVVMRVMQDFRQDIRPERIVHGFPVISHREAVAGIRPVETELPFEVAGRYQVVIGRVGDEGGEQDVSPFRIGMEIVELHQVVINRIRVEMGQCGHLGLHPDTASYAELHRAAFHLQAWENPVRIDAGIPIDLAVHGVVPAQSRQAVASDSGHDFQAVRPD